MNRIAALALIAGLLGCTSAPQPVNEQATEIWRESIEVVWGEEPWYDSIIGVAVRGSVGTVMTTDEAAAELICSRVAISVYDENAKAIGITRVRVVDSGARELTDCPAR